MWDNTKCLRVAMPKFNFDKKLFILIVIGTIGCFTIGAKMGCKSIIEVVAIIADEI
jgi:hypothetical protein